MVQRCRDGWESQARGADKGYQRRLRREDESGGNGSESVAMILAGPYSGGDAEDDSRGGSAPHLALSFDETIYFRSTPVALRNPAFSLTPTSSLMP